MGQLMPENELLPGHKLVFDRELQQYIQVPLEPGGQVGIREALPQAEGYEYPEGMSFFPFRRKQSEWKGIPYAQVPDAPLELTLPGFARTMLNDLWLAFTGPGRAAAGEFTQNELEEVGMRGGSALTWGGMAVPKPSGSLGMSGFLGKKPVTKSVTQAKEIENFKEWAKLNPEAVGQTDQMSADYFNEYTKAYVQAKNALAKSGLYLDPKTLEVFDKPGGTKWDISPFENLVLAVDKAHEAKLNYQSHQEFLKYGVEGKPKATDFSPEEKEVYSSSLKEFEKAYDSAEKELKYWGKHYSLELAPDGGYVVKKNGEDLEYHPDSAIGEIMSKLQAAAKKYDDVIQGAEVGPKDALNEFNEAYAKAQSELKAGGWTEDWFAIEADPDTGYFVPKAWGGNFIPANGGKLASIFDELNKAKDKYVTAAGVPEDFIPYVAPTKKTNELNAPKTNEPVDLSEFEQVPYNPDDFVKPKSKGKLFGVKDAPPSYLEQMKPEQMREYSPSELDWEYQREYVELSKNLFPNAFKDRADFQKQYDNAPLRVLTAKELKNLEYATLGGVLGTGRSEAQMIQNVMDVAGSRRDVPKIMESIKSGQTAPPIVLRHDEGMRILGGNTRLMSALALGKNMPVKVIDIRSLPRRGSHHFDTDPPAEPGTRAANFNRWFSGSKVVDEQGDPMIMYHGTRAHNIAAFDPNMVKKKSGGSRDFVSLSSSPEFASNWAGGPDTYIEEQPLVYPVYVSAKNPGDFRNPEHVKAAAEWKTEQELKNSGWAPEAIKKARDRARVPRPTLIGDSDVKQFKSTLEDQMYRASKGSWTFWEDPQMWKHFGWDGVFMKENADDPFSPLNFAAPNPSQIKSIFNKGWWNPEDPRILYSAGAPLPLDLEPIEYDPFELEPVAGDPFAVEEKK